MDHITNRYRPEVDGLRAVSIVCVILFHAKIDAFQGGYVGVDVFFVISGYLITRNIVSDLQVGTFSIVRFYTRRIRRLFPALIFTLFATFVAAVLWFPPDSLRDLSKDTLATLASVSNVHFWRQANQYFALDGQRVPLLHTWSLSVEEQFYLLWPAGILLIFRFNLSRAATPVILVVVVASLAASQYWLARDPMAAFYLMPFRMFELGIGALCVWAETLRPVHKILSELLFVAGLATIAASVLFLNARTPFPGIFALLPCLGAAVVIHTGIGVRCAAVLKNRVSVGIGLISYSLYLCHWPIFVFYRYIYGDSSRPSEIAFLVLLSLSVATAMYFLIERPFRRTPAVVTKGDFFRLLSKCTALAAPVAVLAALAYFQNGWEWRLSAAQKELLQAQSFGFLPCRIDAVPCAFGDDRGELGVQILGDSHAQHLVAAFQPILLSRRLRGEAYTAGGCLMLMGIHRVLPRSCPGARQIALQHIRESTAPIVLAQAWEGYGDGSVVDDEGRIIRITSDSRAEVFQSALERTFEYFGGQNRQFLIVGPVVGHGCSIDSFRLLPGPLGHAPSQECPPFALDKMRKPTDIKLMLQTFQRTHPSVTLLLPDDYLCDRECPIMRSDRWLYRDATHLTVAGAQYLAEMAHLVLGGFVPQRPFAR